MALQTLVIVNCFFFIVCSKLLVHFEFVALYFGGAFKIARACSVTGSERIDAATERNTNLELCAVAVIF